MNDTKLTDFSAYELNVLLTNVTATCLMKRTMLDESMKTYADTTYGYPLKSAKEKELEALELWRVKVLEAYAKVKVAEEIAMN